MDQTKKCAKCGEQKPFSEFHKDKRQRLGLQCRCKACHKVLAAAWWAKNGKTSYLKQKRSQMEWRRNNPEKYALRQRRYHLKRKYAMTLVEFQERVAAQGGKCACCGRDGRELVIDHDHASGDVRELLCQPCNKMLGCAEDSPEVLRAGATYLEKHNGEDRG